MGADMVYMVVLPAHEGDMLYRSYSRCDYREVGQAGPVEG